MTSPSANCAPDDEDAPVAVIVIVGAGAHRTSERSQVRAEILAVHERLLFCRGANVSRQHANENAISIAFGTERNSGMDRGDLANLTAFVAVADQRSFR